LALCPYGQWKNYRPVAYLEYPHDVATTRYDAGAAATRLKTRMAHEQPIAVSQIGQAKERHSACKPMAAALAALLFTPNVQQPAYNPKSANGVSPLCGKLDTKWFDT
ncbi:MAG TPA: hypothetical protein VHO69_01610, partial [Phototrophicaceae bacterium]|nr:hypothetical protein [Phototrophicaceae bacterium]